MRTLFIGPSQRALQVRFWTRADTLAGGEIEVAGPELAGSLTELGLVDEYRLYLRPIVLGSGKPFFAGPRPPLRLVGSDRAGENAIRFSYAPA